MKRILYINDRAIELSDQSKVGVTFQVNTLADLQSRQGSFSNEFFIPRTPLTQEILEDSSNANSDTTIPYRKNGARYVEGGIEIVPDGFAIIKSFSSGYSVSVCTGNLDPFDQVGDRYLGDLDMSDLDHDYDIATVTGSYANTEGYIYSDIDFRKMTSALTPSNMGRSPFMFIPTLMDRIFDAIDYALGGDLLDDDYYKNMILTTNFRQSESWIETNNSSTALYAPNPITTVISSPTTTVYNIGFPSSGHIVGGIYTVPEQMSASFSAVIPVQFGVAGSGSQFADIASMEIVNVTTATILDADAINPNLDIGAGDERFYTFQVNAGADQYSPGDQIQIRFAQTYSAIGIYKWSYLAGSTFSSNVSAGFIPYLGGEVKVSEIQHELKQVDLVKGVLNMFCAVPQTNVVTKTITINKLNSIMANKSRAIDWSSKIDVKAGVTLSYRDSNYGQSNLLKYSNDSEVVERIKAFPNYATDGEILIDDEVLQEEKTIVQLPFSGTIDKRVPYKNDDYSIDNFTPRVLLLGRFFRDPTTGIVSYYPTQSSSAFFNTAVYETLSFYEAGPTHESFSRNYSTISSIMERYKGVEAFFDLKTTDVLELDFLIPIFLDVHTPDIQLNGFFYLEKVNSFKSGEVTKCKLVRL